jgi:hypothetical protein
VIDGLDETISIDDFFDQGHLGCDMDDSRLGHQTKLLLLGWDTSPVLNSSS